MYNYHYRSMLESKIDKKGPVAPKVRIELNYYSYFGENVCKLQILPRYIDLSQRYVKGNWGLAPTKQIERERHKHNNTNSSNLRNVKKLEFIVVETSVENMGKHSTVSTNNQENVEYDRRTFFDVLKHDVIQYIYFFTPLVILHNLGW